jgi:hypothetical protein
MHAIITTMHADTHAGKFDRMCFNIWDTDDSTCNYADVLQDKNRCKAGIFNCFSAVCGARVRTESGFIEDGVAMPRLLA